MVLRTRIGPDGSIISDGGGDESSSNSGGGGGGGRRRLCPTSVDTFGFHLELKHFAIVLLLVSVTMGPIGSELLLVCHMTHFANVAFYYLINNFNHLFLPTKHNSNIKYCTHQLSCSYPSCQYTPTIKEDPTEAAGAEDPADGKMARQPAKILKELVIFPKHRRVDEVPACVKRLHAL